MCGANTMWGLMSPVSKLVMAGSMVTPIVMTDLRIAGAMILFWIASFFQKKEHVPPKDLVKLFFASLLAIVFNQGCFIFGVSLTSPVDASIITTSMPIITMIIAALYLKEPITGKKIAGILMGASGALLLIMSGTQLSKGGGGNGNIWGDLLILLAQCSYASYIVFYKNFISRYSPVTIMKWMFTFSFICVIPFSYQSLSAMEWSGLESKYILGILFVIVGATFISYLLIPIGQKNLRPTVAGMYNYVQPIVASIVAVYWGMDSFNFMKVLAVILVFSGVFVVTQSRSRAQMEQLEQEKQQE